jgi:hypothetical protein
VAENVWTALVKGVLAFGHSRAAEMTETTFKDSGEFVGSLVDGAKGTSKPALEQLKKDIKDLKAEVQPIVDAMKPKFKAAKDAVTRAATDLGDPGFSMEEAGRVATELSIVLGSIDDAIVILAEKLSKKGTPQFDQAIYDDISGIDDPWKKPFKEFAADLSELMDAIGEQLLGEEELTKKLGESAKFDRVSKELSFKLAKTGERTPVPGFEAFKLDNTEFSAFLKFKDSAVVGIKVKTKLKAGLRSDKLLEKVIPGGAPSSDTDYTSIILDTKDGITFGDGKNKTLMLPFRFEFPGLELREFAIVVKDENSPIEVKSTLAARLGDTVGFVIEGAGVKITFAGGGRPFNIEPRLPDAAGVRISVPGVISGGGYIYRKESEYGGILDLQLLKIGITVIAIVTTEPFSFVVVVAVKFMPKIELSFGFTLNGIGGILAVERRVSTDEFRKGIRDGTADRILFPENPIEEAPKILDKVRNVFPQQPGGFVVGPIALLGWGSQAGFVVAKVGIVLSLPDPKLILLGALVIGVPSADIDPKLRIVDLRAEVYGEFTPEYILILVGLNNSKIVGVSIGGDIGFFVRWAGGANFALSVGGFHPKYTPPPEMAGMRRITIDFSPAKILKLHAEAYFAITANSLQFGGGITLKADIGVASAEAWLKIDILFVWSPRFYFAAMLDIGLEVKVFGFTICGVRFLGTLEGTTPWIAEGKATVDLGLFGEYDFKLGPIEWGERDTSSAPAVQPRTMIQQALQRQEAWKVELPPGGDMLVRFAKDDATELLVHPLGVLEIRQLSVPLELEIDRVGSAPALQKRINLANPRFGAQPAASVALVSDNFAVGHFLNLTKDEQVSRPDYESFACGMKVAAARRPAHGTPFAVVHRWETGFPHESHSRRKDIFTLASQLRLVMRASPVAVANRERKSPYDPEIVEPIAMADAGRTVLRKVADLGGVTEATGRYTTTDAVRMKEQIRRQTGVALEVVAVGLEVL